MREQLLGATLPVLTISLDPGESVMAQAGEFSWMTDSIQMSVGTGGGGQEGMTGAPKRPAGMSKLLLSTFTAIQSAGTVAFAAKQPGSIVGIDIAAGGDYLAHRGGFLASTPGIQLAAGFRQPFAAGVFAGEGFVLQRIGGRGRAWIELAGDVVRYDLDPGESLRVHLGHVGMFEGSVAFQVVRVPGIANRYFGGDTHHFAVLSGPGAVWLQSMPVPVLAASLTPFLPGVRGGGVIEGGLIEGGAVGGNIGDPPR
jgi:uncharacterized protein (AIM24 family)